MREYGSVLRRWRRWLVMGFLVFAIGMTCVSGLAFDLGTGLISRVGSGNTALGAKIQTYGPWTIEERIVFADAIARVKLSSVQQIVETLHHHDEHDEFEGSSYVVALEFTFDVLEYLKGSGSSELKAVAEQSGIHYETALGASTVGTDLIPLRDVRWDDREAVVFLINTDWIPSTDQADRYRLGYLDPLGYEQFTLTGEFQMWLPDAATPTTESGASGQASASSSTEQRFLLEEPPETDEDTTQLATISLSALKSRIGDIEAEITAAKEAGSTEYTHEEYEECVRKKYEKEREVQYTVDLRGEYYRVTTKIPLASGLPDGIQIHQGISGSFGWPEIQPRTYGGVSIGGNDQHLFEGAYPFKVATKRPLPVGEYRIYFWELSYILALCDGTPEEQKKWDELVITVTAPDDVVHEAFFDPVAIGDAVGADATNGQLKPVEFDVEGRGTKSISSIEWEDGEVTMVLSPSAPSDAYDLDFIGLDGNVTLSLLGAEATVSGGTITWDVATQPWNDGDLLMLRMRPAAPPVPTPTPDPTASP